jgi:hypothetical protein
MVIVALQAQMPVRYAGVRNVQLRKYAALFAAASYQYGVEVKRKAQVRTVCRTFVGSTLLRCLLAVDCHHRNEARVRGRRTGSLTLRCNGNLGWFDRRDTR